MYAANHHLVTNRSKSLASDYHLTEPSMVVSRTDPAPGATRCRRAAPCQD